MKKILALTTALTALAASPAHADPVTAIATWVVSTTGIGMATAVALTNFAIGFGVSAISTALFGPKAAAGAANVSFQVEMGDDLPLSFTVGNYATAGKRKYIGSWGKNTRFITEVIEYSALPQGLAGLWVNDERGEFVEGRRAYVYPAVSPGNTTGLSEGSSLPAGTLDAGRPLSNLSDDGNRIYVKVVDGTQTAADPFLTFLFGDDEDYPWTADHIGRGKSYVIVTTRYDSESLTQYPTFLWEPAPLPLYDWRLDSTNGGSGPQRWGNRSTYQPSRNPIVIAYNVARGIHWQGEWIFGGKNLSTWRLPIAEWTAAANACDPAVPVAGGVTEPRYRAGMEIAADMEPAAVLEELGKAANAKFAEVGGRLKPIVDLPGAAVMNITDGDILITEGQSFNPFYPVSETFNAISATYPEPGEKWASKDAPEYIDAASRAEDGDQYLPTSMQYGAVPFARQVQRLMRSQLRDFRRMRRHQFYLHPGAYALEPGIDMISWTSDRNGYVNKLFMVESVNKTPGMNVLVSLREVDPSDYDWSSDFEQPVVVTPPVNPRPFVQPADGFAVAPALIEDATTKGRRPAILATYTGDEAGVREIRMQARLAGGTEIVIDTLRPWNDAQRWHLQNVLPATAYEVRAMLISELTPQRAWSPWLPVTTPDVGLTWEDFEQQLRDDLTAEFEKADQAAQDAIAADQKAQEVRSDHDALVEGFVGKLTDLSAADQGIQQRIDLIEMSVSNSSYIRKTDGDGPAIGQWTALTGAASPVSSTSVPPGQTGRSIQIAAPGAFEDPAYTGASLNGSTFRLRGWIFVSSGATARVAIVGPTGTMLAQSDPISGGWQQVDIKFEVSVETTEWAPAFLVSAGGTMRFWRVRLEDYSAAASLEASIGLNAQAIIDESTARAAQVGTLTARADSLAARIFPSDMRNQAEYWTNSPGLAPEKTAGMAEGVTFGSDAAAGPYVRIPAGHASNIHVLSKAATEYAASKKIRVTVKLRTIGGPTAKLRTLFTTLRADWSVSRFIGNAPAQQVATTAGGTWQTVSVDYTLPAALADEVWLRIGVYSNTSITPDRAIDIASIRIDDLTAASDLVGEVSGEITDIKGLEVDALAGTAFGVLLQQLQVDAGGTSALITTQGSAIADLEGNASAGYLIKARAGGAVSLIDLIAADGTDKQPTSIIKMDARNIILNGTVSAPMLVIHDPANLVPDNQFQVGEAWGLPAGPFRLVNSGPNFNSKGCVRFTRAGAGSGFSGWVQSQVFSVRGNTDFYFEIRTTQITGTVNSVWARVHWFDDVGNATIASFYAPGQRTGNHLGTATLRSPSNAQTALVELIVNMDLTNGDLNIGDVLVRAKEMGSTLITPNGVTSDLISAATMRALNGQFIDLEAANIKIGTAEIDRSHIKELAVDRLRIADESVVTNPVAYRAAAQRVSSTTSWTTVGTLSFTKGRNSPMPVYFRADVAAGTFTDLAGSIRLLRDGVLARQYSLWRKAPNEELSGPNEFQIWDVDSQAGPVTYTLQVMRNPAATGDFIDLTHCTIGVLNAWK